MRQAEREEDNETSRESKGQIHTNSTPQSPQKELYVQTEGETLTKRHIDTEINMRIETLAQ